MASTARQSNTPFARIATVCAALLTAGVLLQSASVRADSFDFINYDPPRGWTVENADNAKVFGRPDRNGVIILHRSRFDNDVEAAFIVTWRELVERAIPGAGQTFTPQILREGDYAIAKGGRRVEFNGKNGVAMLTAIVGKGRRLGIAGIASSDEALREIVAFTNAVAVKEPEPEPDPPPSALVGKWWMAFGNNYVWYEFTGQGRYSYSAPARESQTGTYRVQGNRITLTGSTGRATSHTFRLTCVGGQVLLELEAGSYWASPKQPC